MQTLRIFFTKTGETAYISHLDLQRVMARALRRCGLPVWWSQGFNPHIYMNFALPLPLGQQSLCESVDVKTESEAQSFNEYAAPLDAALPRGISVKGIGWPQHSANEIAAAKYRITYDDGAALKAAVEHYNQLENAVVTRKTKRSQADYDLKSCVEGIRLLPNEPAAFEVTLPVGECGNVNPALLAAFLQDACGLAGRHADVLRLECTVKNGMSFL